MHVMRSAIVFLAVLLMCGAARGEESLEYLVAVSDTVVVARFPRAAFAEYPNLSVDTVEVLKGEAVKRIVARDPWLWGARRTMVGLVFEQSPAAGRAGFVKVIPLDVRASCESGG